MQKSRVKNSENHVLSWLHENIGGNPTLGKSMVPAGGVSQGEVLVTVTLTSLGCQNLALKFRKALGSRWFILTPSRGFRGSPCWKTRDIWKVVLAMSP